MVAFRRNGVGVWAVVAVLGAGGAALAQQAGAYHYRYFAEKVPLTCDGSSIAVFESGTASKPQDAVVQCVKRAGIDAATLSKAPLPKMWTANMPAASRNDAGVRAAVRTAAGASDVDFVSPVLQDAARDPVIVTRYLHVGFAAGVDGKAAEATLGTFGAGVIEARDWAGMANVYRLRSNSKDGFEVLDLANRLADAPGVRFAEPDLILTARSSLIPNDPLFPGQWGLHNTGQSGGTVDMDMDGPEAWDITTGNVGIIVVILDDGTQQNHPDIHQIPGADFTGSGTGGGPLNQCDNHGTAVAGCTSATMNNALGVASIAPGCVVAAAKWNIANVAVPCPGTGSFAISWLVNAISWSQTIGARVTNNSNGFGASASITNIYQTTRNAGIVHFAASGNEGASSVGYPSSLPTVNAVGSINRFGNRSSFSNYGSDLAFVAPGESISTTDRTGAAGYVSGDYVGVNGTSFASPYAAGVAALTLSIDNSLQPADVEQIMNSTCTDRGAVGWDIFYGWGIVNAFGAVSAALPTDITLSGACFYDAAMTQPVDPVTVEVTNLTSSTTIATMVTGNQYTLDLTVGTEVAVGDTLRYIARDTTNYVNVTDHVVTLAERISGALAIDLVLDEFYLDLTDFPQYEADGPNYNQYTGPAVAQMVLNYMFWDSTQDPAPPLTFPDQSVLYTYGLAHNATPALDVFDAVGMWRTIQDHRPLPYSQYGYNFSIRHDTDSTEILKQIAQWVAYEIGTFGGHQAGHPLHVPGVIPAYGDYSNWMAVRGIHTNEDAYPLPATLEVFGFWINDPLPATFGGIGENSYKTAAEVLATYYSPLTTGDAYDGEYVAICEPPDDPEPKELTFGVSPVRFSAEALAAVDEYRSLKDEAPTAVKEEAFEWVVAAAIDGAMEQLAPYDDGFARRFAATDSGTPMLVAGPDDCDYFLSPFVSGRGTAVVIVVNADDGSFKEASWVADPVVYPPVSSSEAVEIAAAFLEEQGIKPDDAFLRAAPELIHQGASPYYPHWRLAGDEFSVLVGQDGSAELGKP